MKTRWARLAAGVALLSLPAVTAARGAVFTVTNTKNSGYGTLRAAIGAANAAPGSTIQFAIPTTDGDYDAATGVFTIWVSSPLPAITGAGTILDATTQAINVGDTNPGVLGTGGTVGVDALALPTVARPEVQIVDRGTRAVGLDIRAPNVVVRGVAIYGFGRAPNSDGSADINVAAGATGALIERNVIGASAASWSDPGTGARSVGDHVRVTGADGGTIRNNLIGFGQGQGLELNSGSSGWLVVGNEFRRNGIGNANLGGMDIENGAGTATVQGNLFVQSEGCGIDGPQSSGGNTIVNNTVQSNGQGSGTALENPGIRLYGTGSTADRNIVSANSGAGVLVTSGSSGNRITRNSIYGNGTGNGEIGIDLLSASDNPNLGTSPFVTPNDSGDADTGGNGLLNFPVLVSASLSGGQLTLTGFARPGSSIEVFLAAPDPAGFGEGQTYLMTLVEGSAQDSDATTGSYTNPVNGLNQGTDTTNRFKFVVSAPVGVAQGSALTATATVGSDTSEFSGNVTVTGGPAITLVKSVSPGGASAPQTDLTYTVVFANGGTGPATSVVILDPVPANTDFKVGSSTSSLGSTGLTVAVAYSSDGGTSWTYTPVSGAGGAPAGYDRLVTNVRWTFTGTLGATPPSNQGSVGFTARIR